MIPEAAPPPRMSLAGTAAALLGLLLFVISVRRAGLGEIVERIGRLGSGLFLILAVSAVREIVRTIAWTVCVEGPVRLRFREAFPARLAGEALGSLTPLGLLVSEPAKAVFVRDRLPVSAGLSATVIENFFYSLTVIVVIAAGMSAFLLEFSLPRQVALMSLASLAAMVAIAIGAAWLIVSRPKLVTTALEWLHGRGLLREFLAHRIERVRTIEERVYGFLARHPRRALPLAGLNGIFHAAGVLEVWVTLAFISGSTGPTWLTAFILESVNRLVTVAFKFIPLRLGVDEASAGVVADVLRLGAAAGVTLAIVRKARVLWWSGVGVALLVHRGLSMHRLVTETRLAIAKDRP